MRYYSQSKAAVPDCLERLLFLNQVACGHAAGLLAEEEMGGGQLEAAVVAFAAGVLAIGVIGHEVDEAQLRPPQPR